MPWHVLALMEEAVGRGLGAFSEREARAAACRWLDLARDAKTGAALGALVGEFARAELRARGAEAAGDGR